MTRNLTDFCVEIFSAIFSAIKSHKFFFIFVFFYCVILVVFSRYAPNLDDLSRFANIYQNEINFYLYTGGNPSEGRFYPFANIDLLFLMQISKSPYLFFGVNAILFIIFAILYIKILNLSNGKSALNTIITALLSLSVAFVTVFFGICYPEKLQVIWLSIFMLCSFCVISDLGGGKYARFHQIIGILSLNIALYYKEPTFIAAFAFGTVLLIFAIQNHQKDLQKYAIYIICSALLYVILYVLLIFVFWNVREYYNQNVLHLYDLISCAFNDSVIIFAVGGILLYRIYCVFIKKEQIEPFFDGLLCASFVYFGAFLLLKMYAPYYLLPCFVLGIPSVLYFGRKYFRNLFIKICLILGLFGFLAQNLPSGIYKMIDLKAQGVQFHRTIDFLASYIKENPKIHIYFQGVGRGREIYGFEAQIYSIYLCKYVIMLYGFSYDSFDIRTSEVLNEFDDMFVVESGTPRANDLIIVSNKNAFGDSLQVASERGELIFRSGFPSVAQIALMPFIKYISVKYFGAEFFGKRTNFFALPRETYVFRVN